MPSPQTAPPIISTLASDPDMAELIQLFVEEIPDRVRTLQDFWQRGDLSELKRLAHQLKGSGGGYGFATLGAAAGNLEHTLNHAPGPQADLETVARQVDELVNLCARVRVA